MTNEDRLLRIGDIYFMRFGGYGSEQAGWRPGLVFQNNTGNAHSPNIIALPLTSSLKKLNQPTHVLLSSNDTGLPRDSLVLCENPECMSKEKIGNYLTTLSVGYMRQIAVASILATSVVSFLDEETLISVWARACSLNATPVA